MVIQVDDKSNSWNHQHHHHQAHHHYSDQSRVSPHNFDVRSYTSESRDDPQQQIQQTTVWSYEGLDRLGVRNPDQRSGHLAWYVDQMPTSQEVRRGYPVTERAGSAVDISEPTLARYTHGVAEGHGVGQDQGMPASRAQIWQGPDACSPSIPAHYGNHFPESYHPQSITKTSHLKNIFTSRDGHELVQVEPLYEHRSPSQRAEYLSHSSLAHTAQRGQEQEYRHSDRRSPQISPRDYDYRGTQCSLSPQALIPPLQMLLHAPSERACRDGGNRMKSAGKQYSPTLSGHYTRDQHYNLKPRGSAQLRHHPYRHSPPPPSRRHSESLSPQGRWTHSPREQQYPQQQQHQQQYQQQHQQQPQQVQLQRTQLQHDQLLQGQTSSREHLASQNRRNEQMELGRQQGKGSEGEELRPKKNELPTNKATISGIINDRGQPRLQPFSIPPLGATGSPASLGQAQEEILPQSRPPVRMTLALSFSNLSSNSAMSRVDRRTLTPQHQYHAQRLDRQQQQVRPSRISAAVVSRPPPLAQEGSPTVKSPVNYDRQGLRSETTVPVTLQHEEHRAAFTEDPLDASARPHTSIRGSSLEARWESRPRTVGSPASNQELHDDDESPDSALLRRHSAADALELGSLDRRGDVRFRQERLQDIRSNSWVVVPGEVCSAHYAAVPLRPEYHALPGHHTREHFGPQQPQQHTMFVEVPGRDSTPGSSSGTGGQLSSTLASPKERFSRNDMSSAVTRVTENGYSVPKQEPMEVELAPRSTTVAAAAAETITGIGTIDYRFHDMELESLPSPVPQGELGQPGYYTEQDIRKLYWQWRTRQEEQKCSGQQRSNSDDRDDRDDVSMGGADEGDAHDGGETSSVWTGSQHEDQHLRDGPGLHHSSQERDNGSVTRNKGKGRKVEKATRYDNDVPKKERVSKDLATGSRGSEDDDSGEDDEKDEDDDEEDEDDGYNESEDGDDGDGPDDGGVGKPMAEAWEDAKAVVARRTRTQTGRRGQLRGHAKSNSTASSRAGTSTAGEGPRRTRAKDEKKHGCDDCHKRFSRPSQLRTHQLTHSGEKPHHCHLCDKDFNVASNLKRHIRTHDRVPRKNSRDGSGVFRGFTQGFQAKHSSSLKASSSDVGRRARSAKTNVGTSTGIARRAAGTNQPLEKLRWMSTETPESSMMAASRQAKNAAVRQRTAEAGSSSSRPGRNTLPSEAMAPTNAQPAAAVDVGAAVSVARLSNLTGGTAAGGRVPQLLPPPTPRASRESDSESTLVDGTQASDGDEDMGDNNEPSPGGSNTDQLGEQ